MLDCNCLIHPFQNDPGTSQHQRIMDELLSGSAKIDARTLADLLDYFVQLSRHINYYDLELNVNDWQPFFNNSVPFTIASLIKYQVQNIESNFALYNSLFEKNSSSTGLQLNAFFIYYRFINKINDWHLTLKDSDLPLASTIEILIKNKLQQPVKKFIQYANAAVKTYGIKRIDFLKLYNNTVWDIDLTELYSIDTSFSTGTKSKFKKINNLNENFKALFPVFLDAVKILSAESEKSLEQSFLPLKEELQKRHQPHLALLFAFLNIFRQLQDDLNQYTRKHLDFFYKDILQFKACEAVPDKAHVIFEIQKQLEKYLIKKGLKVKDGKDENKQEILFSLDDDIVVTKTEIVDKRTLFVNNQTFNAQTYIEGVYIAPAAEKADGTDQNFKDDTKNFPTLGAKYSKYIDPETKLIKPYPNARLGFILGSPVLFLQAGSTRTIEITLACQLNDSICSDIGKAIIEGSKDCCNDNSRTGTTDEKNRYSEFYLASKFYEEVNSALSGTYYYISQDLLKDAIKKGISIALADKLKEAFLLEKEDPLCYCLVEKRKFDATVDQTEFVNAITTLLLTQAEKLILSDIIKPRKALNLLFSGEKEWLEPSKIDLLEVIPAALPSPGANQFALHIKATLNPDKAAVTFYDKDKLKEDYGTTHPLVKVELDDKIKLIDIPLKNKAEQDGNSEGCCVQTPDCCLLKHDGDDKHQISLYHFFRNVLVNEIDPAASVIKVDVCGLKNFIVQNDESVMDVNGPILPFGARPKIDSNFYIGSEEIFLKQWSNIYLNINWKNKPLDFTKYYVAYQTHLLGKSPSNIVTEADFKVQLTILQDGNWIQWNHCKKNISDFECKPAMVDPKCALFQAPVATGINCFNNQSFTHQFAIDNHNDFFPPHDFPEPLEETQFLGIKNFDVNSRHGFIRITLKCQDFQHEIYPFILARQMMAFGKLPKETVDGSVYYDQNGDPIVFSSDDIKNEIIEADPIVNNVDNEVNSIAIIAATTADSKEDRFDDIEDVLDDDFNVPDGNTYKLVSGTDRLQTLINDVNTKIGFIAKYSAIIPNEPWTPTISNMSLDYKAVATIQDIDLIHLYPYADTYKHEEIELQPTLFPTFCDEGSLFLGLQDLVPGDNLNILFQLAEATSDSESEKEDVFWYYLDSNVWKPLRNGFEVLDDATKNLTTSGIIKLSLPANMTKDNTVMPKDLHWIKAAIAKNSKAVSETTAVIPQAIKTIFTNEDANDKLRLVKPLAAGSISKLNEADASVKSVAQPYESFNGSIPEIEGQFYVRVSETLRHKGRAIQAFDYERLALQAFPQLYKVKCINHSFALNAHEYTNDFPYAPGYVTLAVIPDLYKLKAGNSFEPKVPLSIIEDIDAYIRKRTSPFVRFRTMNPRYEKINFCLRVQLVKGKDENYFREKLKQDLKEFLAPWAVGVYDKLTFGQCAYRSDIIRLLETNDYVDFITDLRMGKENEKPSADVVKVCPDTPRSILIAGNIEVCIEQAGCEKWKPYEQCEGVNIEGCDTKPEVIINYCK